MPSAIWTMSVQACVKPVIMDDNDEDDMPLVFKRSKAPTKQNLNSALKQTSFQKPDGQLDKQASEVRPSNGQNSKMSNPSTKSPLVGNLKASSSSDNSGAKVPFDVPDLGVEADRVRREKAERKAKMAKLAKKRKSGARVPLVEESVAKKVRVDPTPKIIDQPLLNVTEEQDFYNLVAFGQEAIPQGYLAMNAALAYMVKVAKEKEEKLKRLEKEKSDLEALVKAVEENTTKAEAKFLAAEKARIEMAMLVQAKVDAEKKNTTDVKVRLAETQAKVIDLEAKVKQVASQIKELVAEEAQKLKLEYHAQLKTEVNGFYRDGWSEASQFCRAPADHKVWDVEGFKINLPYPS